MATNGTTLYGVLPWERTGLVAGTVFKTVEAFARGLVGSIPTRSRHHRFHERTKSTPGAFDLVFVSLAQLPNCRFD
jgi:hypothetical protein